MNKYWTSYRSSLRDECGDKQLWQITPMLVQGSVSRMHAEGVNPATILVRFANFQTVLPARKGASALRDRLIPMNPITATSARTRPRSWTGVNERHAIALDNSVVSPVRSASRRIATLPA